MVYVSINKDDLVQEASNNRGENTANGTKFIHTNGTSKGNFSDAFINLKRSGFSLLVLSLVCLIIVYLHRTLVSVLNMDLTSRG